MDTYIILLQATSLNIDYENNGSMVVGSHNLTPGKYNSFHSLYTFSEISDFAFSLHHLSS